MSKSKVIVGTIGPIEAKNIRFPAGLTITVPMQVPGVHCPQLLSIDPIVVAPGTLEHARKCARRVIENMQNLPHSEQAGDLLAMAYAVLHGQGESEES